VCGGGTAYHTWGRTGCECERGSGKGAREVGRGREGGGGRHSPCRPARRRRRCSCTRTTASQDRHGSSRGCSSGGLPWRRVRARLAVGNSDRVFCGEYRRGRPSCCLSPTSARPRQRSNDRSAGLRGWSARQHAAPPARHRPGLAAAGGLQRVLHRPVPAVAPLPLRTVLSLFPGPLVLVALRNHEIMARGQGGVMWVTAKKGARTEQPATAIVPPW
jgi:hypothetical protein